MAGRLIDEPILIAGAGIGGLSAAIALAHGGIACQLVERSKSFSTHGAGIQLGPNATRILNKWGVLDALGAHAVRPECIDIHDGRTGGTLATVPLGAVAQERYDAPYIAIHRADLHHALLEHARGLEGIALRPHFDVEHVERGETTVTVRARDGATARGSLLIGADGVWSRVREEIEPAARTRFSGKTAWRALLDTSVLPARFRALKVELWMAPSAHLVHYPVQGGKALNLVAVIKDASVEQGWNAPGDPDQITPHFRDWPEEIRTLISGVASWRKWSLVTMPRLKAWSRGNIVLLGDAAHPVLPFLAQGGALAIEDADALATALGDQNASLEDALRAFEAARMGRAAAVQAASRRMGRIYHLSAMPALARNLVLRARRSEALLKSYDWLYRFGDTD